MDQDIRFCTASDGVRISYATMGEGPPLVKAANYLTHLEHDRQSPVWRHWLDGFSRHHTLVRYDARGCGLSDWDVSEYSVKAWVRDLESVVDALDLQQFPLIGISQGAAVSIAYAAKHPERVTHLILYGGFARGRYHRNLTPEQEDEAETMINVIRFGWGKSNPAFRQLFSTIMMPDADDEQIDWLNELAKISSTPENAASMEEAFYHINVVEEAKEVKVPTMVLHARDEASVPFEEGRRLASLIPDARLVPLESRNHILLDEEPAWDRFLAELYSFLGTGITDTRTTEPLEVFPELTPREKEVLELIAQGLKNDEISDRLFISSNTVRNHINHIFSKLQVESRSKAIVLAREAGLGKKTDDSSSVS